MKAAVFHEHGGPEQVRIEQVETPEPDPGTVRVAVRAAALNHLDLWVRAGLPIETTMPHIGGADVAGVVDALGANVTDVAIGERVVVDPSLSCGACEWCARSEQPLCLHYRILGEHTQGGFAEYVVVPARNLYPIPDDYPFELAAATPLVFATAWRGLMTRGRLQPGETVLVTGASGGVGSAAIQLARRAGADVFAVTSTPHVEQVRELGADVVYNRDEVDFSRAVWRDTGKRGVDMVFDGVGAATFQRAVRSLTRKGRLVVYGATTGPLAEVDLRMIFWKQLELIGTTMSNAREFREVMAAVFAEEVRPVVDVVWPLERARDAHERLAAGENFGKIVLQP